MAKDGDQQTQQQNQNSTTQPWEPAQGLLKQIIGNYSGQSTAVTGDQTSALNNLNSAAAGLTNYGPAGGEVVNSFLNSSTAPQVGMLRDAYGNLQTNLNGTASGAELDPYKTPGFSDAIGTMTNDIMKNVKSSYSASGRSPSGAGSFAQSAGRGIAQGVAPVIASQYNTNKGNQLNANNTLFNAGGSTASGVTNQNQTQLNNSGQGLSLAQLVQQLSLSPAQAQLAAANTSYQTPYSNISAMLPGVAQIGGMGGQTSGNSTATTTQQQSLMSNILGGASAGIGMLSFLSDERAKEDIEPVGKLDDDQTVYRYRYKGDPRMQIGLLAQEVETREPAAVSRIPRVGLLAVDYRKATDRAAEMRKAA